MRGLFVATVGLVVVGLSANGGAQTALPRTTAQPKPAPVASHAPPTPAVRPSQRQTRPEWRGSAPDSHSCAAGVNASRPPDAVGGGYDNTAIFPTFPPGLMKGYLRTAAKVSGPAMGAKNATRSV